MKVGLLILSLRIPLFIWKLVADFYIDLYNAIKAKPDAVGHGREGFYILLNGEHTLYDVCKEIGRALVASGKATSELPTTFTQEEVNLYFNVSLDHFRIRLVERG
jgi:hypothetical protein